ncbi:MAG: hypothetical protein ACRDH5_12615 [bacterium]
MPRRDRAAASIVGTVLIVAITIAVVAGGAVFFYGVAHSSRTTKEAVPPTAATLTASDTDDDFATDTMRLLLIKSELAPFDGSGVAFIIEGPGGSLGTLLFIDEALSVPFGVGPADSWAESESLYAACTGAGEHTVTMRAGAAVVWQRSVRCGESRGP